jgi:hypothetical protein
MRWLTNAILGLIIVGMAVGLGWQHRRTWSQQARIETVRQALRAIQSEAIYHPAVGQVDAERTGFAKHVDPEWFNEPPKNALVRAEGVRCPWIDQPMGSYRSRFNPVYIVADEDRAAFWYNPSRGVVRARVPRQLSQQATVDLYNRVNGTALHIDEVAWNHDRKTAWVDSGPPDAVVTNEDPARADSAAPNAARPGSAPQSGPADSPSEGKPADDPSDPILRDFSGGS